MMRNRGHAPLGGIFRTLSITSAALLISAPLSFGQSEATTDPDEAKAIAACTEALTADYGAIELSDISHLRQSGHRSVYATVRLANGEAPRFRCLVGDEGSEINKIEVYSDGSLSIGSSSSGWISADQYRVQSEADTGSPVETPTETEAPAVSGPQFKSPGAATGFKKPGALSGSRFIPAK